MRDPRLPARDRAAASGSCAEPVCDHKLTASIAAQTRPASPLAGLAPRARRRQPARPRAASRPASTAAATADLAGARGSAERPRTRPIARADSALGATPSARAPHAQPRYRQTLRATVVGKLNGRTPPSRCRYLLGPSASSILEPATDRRPRTRAPSARSTSDPGLHSLRSDSDPAASPDLTSFVSEPLTLSGGAAGQPEAASQREHSRDVRVGLALRGLQGPGPPRSELRRQL